MATQENLSQNNLAINEIFPIYVFEFLSFFMLFLYYLNKRKWIALWINTQQNQCVLVILWIQLLFIDIFHQVFRTRTPSSNNLRHNVCSSVTRKCSSLCLLFLQESLFHHTPPTNIRHHPRSPQRFIVIQWAHTWPFSVWIRKHINRTFLAHICRSDPSIVLHR